MPQLYRAGLRAAPTRPTAAFDTQTDIPTRPSRPKAIGHRARLTSAPAFSSFRQPRLPQRVVHLFDVFGREAVHAIEGISLADREVRPQLQELRDFCLRIIQPTEERQRICRVEMAKPESVEISVPKMLQRLLIFAPPPVPFRRPVPPGKRGVGARQANGLFRDCGALIPISHEG